MNKYLKEYIRNREKLITNPIYTIDYKGIQVYEDDYIDVDYRSIPFEELSIVFIDEEDLNSRIIHLKGFPEMLNTFLPKATYTELKFFFSNIPPSILDNPKISEIILSGIKSNTISLANQETLNLIFKRSDWNYYIENLGVLKRIEIMQNFVFDDFEMDTLTMNYLNFLHNNNNLFKFLDSSTISHFLDTLVETSAAREKQFLNLEQAGYSDIDIIKILIEGIIK